MAQNPVKIVALLTLFFLSSFLVEGSLIPSLDVLTETPVNHSVYAQFVSEQNTLDAPHLSAINSTVFEWWYFDFVTLDLSTSIVVIFYTSTGTGFTLLDGIPGDLYVSATVTFSDNTTVDSGAPPSKAIIASHGRYGDGVNAHFEDVGNFSGTPDLRHFDLDFDTSDEPDGFRLSLSLESIAPAHLGCSGTPCDGETLLVMPHLGWTNAVPDSSAVASLTLPDNSTQLLEGSGYHDHNWGDVPWPEIVSHWYWGRGRVGPYSYVFFTGQDAANGSFANGYVSKNGRMLVSSCTLSSTTTTATNGAGGEGDLQVLAIDIPIDSNRVLSLTFDVYQLVAEIPGVYYRWTGNVTGGVHGSPYTGGVGVVEHFPPSS